MGRGRATQLAARLGSGPQSVPLYRISESGRASLFGQLAPVETGEWYLQADDLPPVHGHGEFKIGLYPGWPWFLEDIRPAGFLGRAFARHMGSLFGYDPDPQRWSDSELARALGLFGSNLPGHFMVGARALDEFQREKVRISEDYFLNNTPAIYPQKADLALNEGEVFGSSAAGEHPKFTTFVCDSPGGPLREVIVKFSPPGNTPVGRRWMDLLWAEHFANETLSKHGFASAKTQVLELEGRAFLESERFDRVPVLGRRGVVSLRAVDAAFIGQGGGSWADAARSMHAGGFIDADTRDRMIGIHCFGELIGNTDMHFGNVSFFLQDTFPLPLCPVYDMLPMRFRPMDTGEIRDAKLTPKLPRPEDEAIWRKMLPAAIEYWDQLARRAEVSGEFRGIAQESAAALRQLRSFDEGH